MHKSIRNSDASATTYWLTRMMAADEDGNYIARRLIRTASADVGLADPRALRVALDAADAFHRLGYPEGKLALLQAAVYLARAPKSNALYTALGKAEEDVERTAAEPVPLHLRNAPTGLMKELGYGARYRYAHDDPCGGGDEVLAAGPRRAPLLRERERTSTRIRVSRAVRETVSSNSASPMVPSESVPH